ncbi:hypothetical protein KF913_25425 [Candidatus Obscuribacterales bacterium]|nr:hypothetical protein [Candidatus Obscuribacterales bacterium]
MRAIFCLVVTSVLLQGEGAWANWRDDNPNQPNGYAASMYRYHHGTPDDDGPHDGYRASEFRARNGLDRFAPPSEDDSGGGGRWGDSGGRFGGGSGLGRHFRQGQAESQAFWQNRMQSQMQNQLSPAGGAASLRSNYMRPGLATQPQHFQLTPQQLPASSMPQMPMSSAPMQQVPGQQMRQYPPMYETRVTNPAGGYAQGFGAEQATAPAFPGNYAVPMSNSYHYAPNSTAYGNPSALRSAVMQHPVGSLLRNSQGGFNRIYAPQQY